MAENSGYRSFLLRLWQENGAEESILWRGEIESIQTGQKWQFAGLEAMCDFLRAQVLVDPANQPEQQNDEY